MLENYITPADMSTFDYYKQLIPMYLQESFGFVDQFKLWYELTFVNKDAESVKLAPVTDVSGIHQMGSIDAYLTVNSDYDITATFALQNTVHDINYRTLTIKGESLVNSDKTQYLTLEKDEIYTVYVETTPKSNANIVILIDPDGITYQYSETFSFKAKAGNYTLRCRTLFPGPYAGYIKVNVSLKKARESSIVSTMRDIFNSLNIFNKDDDGSSQNIVDSSSEYLAFLNTIRESSTQTEVLDKLARLYGVSRNFSVSYVHGTDTVKKELNLADEALLLLIKCQVIKNAFQGTFEHLKSLYAMIDLPVMILTESPEGNERHDATCRLVLLRQTDDDYTGANNPLLGVEDMFLSGLLTIQSLGIKYTYEIETAGMIAIFDYTNADVTLQKNKSFDHGVFVK